MSSLQPVRGTRDIYDEDQRRFRRIVDSTRAIAATYGFAEMQTPIFEFTEVFKRTLGETSDIVTKEMYTFTRADETLTLRPEGTAGVARAVISNSLTQNLPLKVFYSGPMFRYERPQKGRMRQFHQVGVELLGVPEPLGDVEVISMAAHVLAELGVLAKTRLELNSLGDAESRAAYREVLVTYLSARKDKLSEDSRARLERNPLRILDSKDEGDKAVVAEAPILTDHLNEASKAFFASLKEGLDAVGIPYAINPRLVRGLDYYCHTAFEFTTDALGAQGTVLAGGRYDNLISMMGGPATPGIGWAAGIERLSMLLAETPPAPRPIAIIPVGEATATVALRLTQALRCAGFTIDLGYRGNVKKRMARANKLSARAAVLLGEDELARDAATVRDLDTGEQTEVALAEIAMNLFRFR